MTIAPVPATGHVTEISAAPAAASATKAVAQRSSASAAGSNAEAQAALNRMLATYARDQSHGTDSRTLAALSKQIMSAAKAIGVHVTLPHAQPASVAAQGNSAPVKGKVNVTA